MNFCSACFQPEAVEPALLTAELQPLPPADASSSPSEPPCLWTRATAWTGAKPSHNMGCCSAESLPCILTITQLLLEMLPVAWQQPCLPTARVALQSDVLLLKGVFVWYEACMKSEETGSPWMQWSS